MKFSFVLFIATLVFYSLSVFSPRNIYADELTWVTSKQEAFTLAKQQGKKVLLVAGRDT